MADPALVRAAGLFFPLLLTTGLWLLRRPDERQRAGILLAWLWNLPSLLLLHALAERLGWWRFEAEGGVFLGFPVDLYLGWAVLWSAAALLAFDRLHLLWMAAVVLSLDLLFMPTMAPVLQLGEAWLLGEAVGVVLCLLPAQLLGRWTARDEQLGWRVVLQVACFTSLLLGVIPSVVLELTGGSWGPLLERPVWLTSLAFQLLALPAVVGLSAVQEFAGRGGGTPVPHDPPKRLVTSGPYAYLSNPMQASATVLLLGWGLLLESAWVAAAAVVSLAYSLGLAAWDEQGDLVERFGPAWLAYRRAVRPWLPRWRPYVGEAVARERPRLYVAASCGPCSQLGAWLRARDPRGLEIVDAEDYPARDLARLTYDPRDGTPEAEGVAALARALEHLHLGWAYLGWVLRLPLVCQVAQLFADAVGGGPRLVPRRRPPA